MEQDSRALEVLRDVASNVAPMTLTISNIQDKLVKLAKQKAVIEREIDMIRNRLEAKAARGRSRGVDPDVLKMETLQKRLQEITIEMTDNLSRLQELSRISDIEATQFAEQLMAAEALQQLGDISEVERDELTNMLRETGLKIAIEEEFINLQKKELADQSTSLQNLMTLATRGPSELNAELSKIIEYILVQDSTIPLTPESIRIIKEYLEDKFTPRVLLGDVGTGNQCVKTIGESQESEEFNFLKENPCKQQVKEWVVANAGIDVLTYPPHSPIRRSRCWLCGLPLGPRDLGPLSPECEHVLPVALAATFFDIYDTDAASRLRESGTVQDYLQAISGNYSWAHSSCNASDKGHFDANQDDPLIKFIPVGPEGGAVEPVLSTYQKIVNGWTNKHGVLTGGIKNRLLQQKFALHCLSQKEREAWAQKRVEIIYNTYNNRCYLINQKLASFPTLYPLSLAAYYLGNATSRIRQVMNSAELNARLAGAVVAEGEVGPVVAEGEAGPSNAAPPKGGKKTKRKRKYKKNLRYVNKSKTNKKSRKNKTKKLLK
tara:strand:+ start:24524 stop:26164 length:1641 start_codon:yes stop_codon:yes gene_type:complete